MDIRIGETITAVVLGASVLGTFFFSHERGMENESLVQVIQAEVRAEVRAEMDRRYRNVPRIEINKVYTLHATGEDLMILEDNGDGTDVSGR